MKLAWQLIGAVCIVAGICLFYAPQAKSQIDAKAAVQSASKSQFDAMQEAHYAPVISNMEKLKHKKEVANASKNRPDNGRRVDGDTMR